MVNADSKTITVKGFDYTANAVTKTTNQDGTVTWSGGTVGTIAVAGNMISVWLSGGTATGAAEMVTFEFTDSEANVLSCTGQILVI